MSRKLEDTDYVYLWNVSATRSSHVQETTLKALQDGNYLTFAHRYYRKPLYKTDRAILVGYKVYRKSLKMHNTEPEFLLKVWCKR